MESPPQLRRFASSPRRQRLIDSRLETTTSAADWAASIRQISPQFGAHWVRLIVDGRLLEPQRGAYEPAQVRRLDDLVDSLHARGVKGPIVQDSLLLG